MSVGDILVCPMDVVVTVGCCIPRHMVVVRKVLRNMQNRTVGIAASVEHTTMPVRAFTCLVWLRLQVTNNSPELNATNETPGLILSEEEKHRLAQYFSVLIEMNQQKSRP